ncbi:hypothetical protein NT2_05_01850 [Caenibius tardaugens NBRC 16725]|uniref:Uncharacterized protein n=1 Tax=Caenibius tardaugens NBRC 16725 TaxID=1219035 RepID=U2YL02_9SPHN|nr:hypothetical protein NT2_05_01850 [Caenibius tardaugens NBRC 16725]
MPSQTAKVRFLIVPPDWDHACSWLSNKMQRDGMRRHCGHFTALFGVRMWSAPSELYEQLSDVSATVEQI